MTQYADESVYLLVVRFGSEEPIPTRLEESLPIIQRLIDQISSGRYKLAFQSPDCGVIGFLLVTQRWAEQTLRQIINPGRDYVVRPLRESEADSRTIEKWRDEIDTSPIQRWDQIHIYELSYDHQIFGANVVADWLKKSDPRE